MLTRRDPSVYWIYLKLIITAGERSNNVKVTSKVMRDIIGGL